MRVSTFVVTRDVRMHQLENKEFNSFVYNSLHRFQCGDWGDCCEEDAMLNDTALNTGERIVAVYESEHSPEGKLWIIADATDENGKRVVTVLFPSEY